MFNKKKNYENEKIFFLVESPFQFLNAYEAIGYFNFKKYKIFIRYSNQKKNDNQLNILISKLNFKENCIKKITISSHRKNILDVLKIFYYKVYFFYYKNKIKKLFVGNLESGFFRILYNQLKKDKIIALDDGSKTIAIQDFFNTNNYYNFFTMYDLKTIPGQKIFINEYSEIKKSIKININTKSILFIGSCLSENGLINEKYYLSLLKKITNYYDGKTIIYVPHRFENPKKLNKLKIIGNIVIKHLNYPIELYGIYEKDIPYKVASFYSTALLTLKKIYFIDVESFYFDFSGNKEKECIEKVYKFNKKYMRINIL